MPREHNFSGNYPQVMAQKMLFESLREGFWGPLSAFTTPKGVPVSPQNQPVPTSSIVSIQNELGKKEGDYMEIPKFRNLDNMPKIGSQQLEGLEEERQINYALVPVMTSRHAEKAQNTTMDEFVLNGVSILKSNKPALQNHYVRYEEYAGASYAMYHGFSWDILKSGHFSTNSKIYTNGVTGVSHPHVFVAGDGKVPYTSGNPGTAGYETLIGTKVTALGSGDVLDTGVISAMAAHSQIKKIRPVILKSGVPLRLLVAHPYQIATLRADTEFNTVESRAMVGKFAKENSFLTNAHYIYGGFAIYESETAVYSASVSGGKVVWGPATTTKLSDFESYESQTAFGALVLGQNALYKGIGSNMKFIGIEKDYGEYLGMGYRIIQGYARGDFWNRDDGAAGEHIVNDSSAIVVTYAAAPPF